MSLSIERKVSLSAIFVLFAAISVISSLFVILNESTIVEQKKKQLSSKADRQLAYLQREFARIKQDINYISGSPYLVSIINQKSNDFLPHDSNADIRKLEEELARLVKYRDSYAQIELIENKEGGKELIRIARMNGSINSVPRKGLNEDEKNPFLNEASGLSKNQFYIAEVEDYEMSGKDGDPIISISHPLYSHDGNLFGILEINVDFTFQLNHIANDQEENEHFLIGLPNGKFIFYLHGNEISGINKEPIKQSKAVMEKGAGDIHELFMIADKQSGTYINKKSIVVHRDLELSSGRNIRLIFGNEITKLENDYYASLNNQYYLLIPVVLFLVAATIFFARLPLRQLNELGSIIKGITTGERKREDLPVDLGNEVGDLSRSFNSLLDKIEESEKRKKKVQEQLELAIRATSDGIWDWNLKSKEIFLSPRWKEMLGYRDDEIQNDIEAFNELLHPDDVERTWELVNTYLDGKAEKFEIEFRMRHKDGHDVDILSRAYAVRDNKGHLLRLVGTHTDISDRNNEIMKRLRYEQEQKKTLVREVHHRIKNNLQGVASLLRQQTEKSENYKKELDSAISQVFAVAMVHGIQGKSAETGIFLFDIVNEIIKLTKDLTGIEINAKGVNKYCIPHIKESEAVPIALVINELIMNACKYSNDQLPVSIDISCCWCADYSVTINIRNNIESFPSDFDLSEKTGLGIGLGLVTSLLPPKGATLKINDSDGVCYTELTLQYPVIFMESILADVKVRQA